MFRSVGGLGWTLGLGVGFRLGRENDTFTEFSCVRCLLSGVSRSSDKSVAASQFCSFWVAKYDKLATLEFK